MRKNKKNNDPDNHKKKKSEEAITAEEKKEDAALLHGAISVEDSVKKENMVPAGGEAIVAGLFVAEETVDKEKMIPDDSTQKPDEEADTRSEAEIALEEEQAMISKMADDEIEVLTAGLSMEVAAANDADEKKATEELIDRLLDLDFQ